MPLVGEFSAIAAAACWVVTAMVLAAAGRRVGATVVNATRIWLALLILLIVHRLLIGEWWPPLTATSWWCLGASGVIGLTIGDQFLYRALIDAGPRISTLVMTVAPALTALLAWPVLDEPMAWLAIIGMLLTLAGIAWVVVEREQGTKGRTYPNPARGIVFGLLGGVGQAIGLVLAKLGMGEIGTEDSVGPWSATLVRMLFGGIGATVLFMMFLAGRFTDASGAAESESASRLSGGRVFICILIGAIFGPVLGVWLGLVSIERIDAGVAATLMSLSPIFILPVARIVEHEHISMRAVFGAVLAVIGVAVLVLSTSTASPADQDEVVNSDGNSSSGWTSIGASPFLKTRAIAPDSAMSSS
jgi:drug/metabolite transporter (DMT)-like permease